jgi:hypothetical protein
VPSDRIGFDAVRTVRAASVGYLAETSVPAGGLVTREDIVHSARSGSSVGHVPRRIIEEDKWIVVNR